MDTSIMYYSSPIRTYMDNYHKMRVSNDTDTSDPNDLCSLGVVDLDLSLSSDGGHGSVATLIGPDYDTV